MMNTFVKAAVISAAVAVLGNISVAQAGQSQHYRSYDRQHVEKHARHYRDRGRGHRHERHRSHDRHYRHGGHHGHDYRRRGHGHWHGHRHLKRHFHAGFGFRPHRHVVPAHVVVERRRHAHHLIVPDLPVVVGGLIGSAIANDVSNGDPAATVGGAVIGAVIGGSLSY